jgi:hypothetical protein
MSTSRSPKKPRPSLAVLQWIDAQGVDAEEAINEYQEYEADNCLAARLRYAVWLTEFIGGNIARETIAPGVAVDKLRMLHRELTQLWRDLDPSAISQHGERKRWNHAAGSVAPWVPPTVGCENARYTKPEEGAPK